MITTESSGGDILSKPTMPSIADAEDSSPPFASLLASISVVAQLAAMDTSEYHTLMKATRSSTQESRQDESFPFVLSLAEVERQYGLTDTPIANLTQCIHQFHSNTQELDHQATEISSLHQMIVALQKKNQELETDKTTLTMKNEKLTKKLEQKSKEKKCLASHVKAFLLRAAVSEEKEQDFEELKVAYKLQAHEQYLMKANRGRTTSVDSDGLDFGSLDDSSVSSLVTDDGVATLQLSPHYSPGDYSIFSDASQGSVDSLPGSPRMQPYTLEFPRGARVGLRIRELPVEAARTPKTPTLKPNADLTRAMTAGDGDSQVRPDEKQGNNNPFAVLDFTKMNIFQNNNHKGNSHNNDKDLDKTEQQPARHVFVVSGYCDFDARLNTKPAVGARILAINNVQVPETCTLQELIDSLAASSASDLLEDNDGTYSVTFRNDPLTAKQREELKDNSETTSALQLPFSEGKAKAHHQSEKKTEPSKTAKEALFIKPSDMKLAAFNFGFLNRGAGEAGDKTMPTTNASPANTKSSDSPRDEALPEEGSRENKQQHFPNVFNPFRKQKNQNEDMKKSSTEDELL
jgi:hypothetical protein